MKRTLISALLALVGISAIPAFAQSSGTGLTRAEVKAQLVVAEESGRLPEQTPRNSFPATQAATPHTYAVAPHHTANTAVANNTSPRTE
jgi:Domain of unknown function (DUF4148)